MKQILHTSLSLLLFAPTLTFSEEDWKSEEKQGLEALTHAGDNLDFGQPPTEEDKELLKQFKPRIFIKSNELPPIDFYDFYLPHAVLKSENGNDLKKNIDRNTLKEVERKKGLYLDYQGPSPKKLLAEKQGKETTGYGRVFREHFDSTPLLFLKYHFVFLTSGLPAKLPWYKEWGSKLAGDPQDWHELDIHGAIHLVLKEDKTPIALLLAQHNHFRTYLFGKDLEFPADGKLKISFSERSHEPYPHPEGSEPVLERTISNPTHIKYLILGKGAPLASGFDLIYGLESGGKEVKYALKFLPEKDPLYVSLIPLGDKRKLFGLFDSFYRTGPPGVNMCTWHQLKGHTDIMRFWYFRDGSEEDARIMNQSIENFLNVDFDAILQHNGNRLRDELKALGKI